MKPLAILGSTGSIGVNTLDVVASSGDRYRVLALAAGRNLDLLEEQVRRFEPELVCTADELTAKELAERIGSRSRVVHGEQGLIDAASHPGVEMVVGGLVGALGIRPTHAALSLGRDVALANKETLVVAGLQMTRCARENRAAILPVDSEHNALHQCLRGERIEEVRRLWLTASGGPFREAPGETLAQVTPEQALRHPTWKMGPKVTIDSATLMNKGLEVIEARWLFDLGPEAIRVVIHPTSVVHSMVEFVDGSFKAQLGITDMRHPIQYSLSWPERLVTELPSFDPVKAGPLVFEEPDLERFPCLGLAYRALEAGGAAGAVLNAANEVAVEAFLAGRCGFMDIPRVVETALDRRCGDSAESIDDLLAADRRTRGLVSQLLEQGVRS